MQVSPFVPRRTRALIRFSGMPQSPKPPTIRVMPSAMPSRAASAEATTLFIARGQGAEDRGTPRTRPCRCSLPTGGAEHRRLLPLAAAIQVHPEVAFGPLEIARADLDRGV